MYLYVNYYKICILLYIRCITIRKKQLKHNLFYNYVFYMEPFLKTSMISI